MKTINTYEELEKMEQSEFEKLAFNSGKIKNTYNYYFIETAPYYGIVLGIFNNNKLIDINSQIHYTYILEIEEKNKEKQNKLISHLLEIANYKLFTIEELKAKIKNYGEYKEKRQFIQNYLTQIMNGWSAFKPNRPESFKYFDGLTFTYFEDSETIKTINEIIEQLEKQHEEKILNNAIYFKNAIYYELVNYEVIYGGRFEDALSAIGLDSEKLTAEQEKIMNQEYSKILKRHCKEW